MEGVAYLLLRTASDLIPTLERARISAPSIAVSYATTFLFAAVIESRMVGPTDLSGRGSAKSEDAQGTLTQSHISASIV